MQEAADRNQVWRRLLEEHNEIKRLIDELIPRLLANEN